MLHIDGIAHWLNAFVRVDVSAHQPHQRVPRKSVRTRELPQDRYDRLARQQPPRIEYEAQCRGQPSFIEAEYREARDNQRGRLFTRGQARDRLHGATEHSRSAAQRGPITRRPDNTPEHP